MDDGQHYKYYLLGERVPVRVTLNTKGWKVGAEVPDAQTGMLVIDHRYLSRIEQSPEVDEIDEAEFHRRCDEFFQRKRQPQADEREL